MLENRDLSRHLSEEEIKSLVPEIYSMRLRTRWPYYDPEDTDRSWKYHVVHEENLEDKEIIIGHMKGILSRYTQENDFLYYPDLYEKIRISLAKIIKFPLDSSAGRCFHVTYIDPYIPIEYYPYHSDKKYVYIFNQETNQYIKYFFSVGTIV